MGLNITIICLHRYKRNFESATRPLLHDNGENTNRLVYIRISFG